MKDTPLTPISAASRKRRDSSLIYDFQNCPFERSPEYTSVKDMKKNHPVWMSCDPTDLENFSQTTRSPVKVREGQGVVLLCGPPLNSGGECSTLRLRLRSGTSSEYLLSYAMHICVGTKRGQRSRFVFTQTL